MYQTALIQPSKSMVPQIDAFPLIDTQDTTWEYCFDCDDTQWDFHSPSPKNE
jgi:hypothetical protein